MFGIDSNELLVIAVVALVVIGPKDLPRVMRVIGQFVGRARGMARHFRSGVDAMIRETELQDMDKKWRADNERIMREHPAAASDDAWAEPADMTLPAPAAKSTRPKPPPTRGGARPGGAAPPIPARPAPPPASSPDEGG